MKFLIRLIFLLLCVVMLIGVASIVFSVSDKPELQLDWILTREDVIRARKLLHEGSKTKPDEIGTIELSREDLNLAANYLLNRYSKSAVQISLKPNKLRFEITTTLPENKVGKYLNITIQFGNEKGNKLPVITKFKAGKLLLPANISAWIITTFIEQTFLNEYFILAKKPIESVKIDSDKLTIRYFSNLEALIQARSVLSQTNNGTSLHVYQDEIAKVLAKHDPKWRLSLADLLKPMFALALQRSTLENAIEENRVLIMAANDYINKQEIKQFLPPEKASKWRQYVAFMYKRSDLAQHFIASAALTASANGQISKVVGEEKELSDAKDGSGFSFVDLAADKAGIRFGETAISSPENARKLQVFMSNIKDYRDFMPDSTDLPEKMNAEEFKNRYGFVNSPAYLKLSNEIDARIAATPLYKAN